ncbi:hypothetical protein GJV85_13155 [Sulfurimonas aquatica]|uniref:Chemoreceptor zinc-binding domain-containing protein n=1 Tax=Sulfurimonas aquatica TaxID=2672570 RepID=A0A975GDW4_9BACT|nr:CZB domain-containing protein [Sulfurimonas aquatica]QSZ43012.1 hypothetical protein GJV85_13155 [Sulfurimonas aquatica]
MNKEDVLAQVEVAKLSHTEWVDHARRLMNGFEIQKSATPVNPTECDFGLWFYGSGQLLSSLSNNPLECMQNIEKLHLSFHTTYSNIFNIYFSAVPKKGFFTNFFDSKIKDIDADDKERVKTEFKKMQATAKELFEEISRLERRLGAVSDEKISALGA